MSSSDGVSIRYFYVFFLTLTTSSASLSHCIAEWGPSFRPDYLKVARFAREVGAERVLALTATATPSVAQAVGNSSLIL